MNDKKMYEAAIEALITIFCLCIVAVIIVKIAGENAQKEYITQLEQNNIEQAEEKEVYINRCKMYEDLLKANGLLDECECR